MTSLMLMIALFCPPDAAAPVDVSAATRDGQPVVVLQRGAAQLVAQDVQLTQPLLLQMRAAAVADQPVVVLDANGSQSTAPLLRIVGQRLAGDVKNYATDDDAADDENAAPKFWIGVRLTPIPAPLAAHVGDDGLMILNIVKDSPADKAALQQYDVAVEFNGAKLDSEQQLRDAIQAIGAGKGAALTIIRGGKRQTVTVQPAERDPSADVEYKYAEPQADAADAVRAYGHALRMGPNGQWQLDDLGQLHSVPDLVRPYLLDLPNIQWNIPNLNVPNITIPAIPPAGATSQHEVQITVVRNGETLSVQSGGAGAITVTRTDKDGNKKTTTYDSEDELRKADAEAADLLGGAAGGAIRVRVGQPGDDDDLPAMQRDFQLQIEKLLRDAQQQTEETRRAAEDLRARVERGVRGESKSQGKSQGRSEGRAQSRAEARSKAAGQPAERVGDGDRVRVRVADDGSVKVSVTNGDDTAEYDFRSRDELRTKQPKLYERVKALLE